MKRCEMTREVKEELWRRFDDGQTSDDQVIAGHKIPPEAVVKQRGLWSGFRARNPKHQAHDTQSERTAAS